MRFQEVRDGEVVTDVSDPILVPRRGLPVQVVVSGGQTGADRAGLDAAIAVGIPHAGFCPKGRLSEDGSIPEQYRLEEASSSSYTQRTALNVKHAAATMLCHFDGERLTGGSLLTQKLCKKHNRPLLMVGLHPTLSPSNKRVADVIAWLKKRQVTSLNIAGPRESKAPGIYDAVFEFLCRVLGREVADDAPSQPADEPLVWVPEGVR